MKKERWVIWMPCKGYVRRYLLTNFNRPDENWAEIVNLKPDKVLLQSFYNHLKRNYTPSVHASRNYPVMVPIEYTRTAFNRYGWELSDRDLLEFNNELEARVKGILYSYVVSMRVIAPRRSLRLILSIIAPHFRIIHLLFYIIIRKC